MIPKEGVTVGCNFKPLGFRRAVESWPHPHVDVEDRTVSGITFCQLSADDNLKNFGNPRSGPTSRKGQPKRGPVLSGTPVLTYRNLAKTHRN